MLNERRVRQAGLDKLRKKEKLCHLSAGKAASNTDVERWVTSCCATRATEWAIVRSALARPVGRLEPRAIAACFAPTMSRRANRGSGTGRAVQDTPPHRVVQTLRDRRGAAVVLDLRARQAQARDRAPVVVFLHGWFAVNPGFYGAWIDHLVRDGKIVIFPRYQNDVGTLPQDFLPNALAAIRDALGVLHDGVGHVRPDPSRFALIGHSAGGNLAAQIAAVAADPHADLPLPQALVIVDARRDRPNPPSPACPASPRPPS